MSTTKVSSCWPKPAVVPLDEPVIKRTDTACNAENCWSDNENDDTVWGSTCSRCFERSEDEFCWGLCCFKGCIIGAVGLAYFFLIIPTGILLIFHGMNKNVSLTIVIGSLVLVVPTCVVIPSCLAIKYYRKKWKDRRDELKDKKKTYQYDNPFKSETEFQL